MENGNANVVDIDNVLDLAFEYLGYSSSEDKEIMDKCREYVKNGIK